jgi:hypothetical protein
LPKTGNKYFYCYCLLLKSIPLSLRLRGKIVSPPIMA